MYKARTGNCVPEHLQYPSMSVEQYNLRNRAFVTSFIVTKYARSNPEH